MDVKQSGQQEVYLANRDGLIRFAATIVGPNNAEDVMIEGVVGAMGSRPWPGVDNRGAYLYQSVLNAARTHLRAAARRQRRELRAHVFSPRRSAIAVFPREDVGEAIRRLSARQRAVVYLTSWEDLDERGVADRLGISAGSVRTHLHRARRQLESHSMPNKHDAELRSAVSNAARAAPPAPPWSEIERRLEVRQRWWR